MIQFFKDFWFDHPYRKLHVAYAFFSVLASPVFFFLLFDIQAAYNFYYLNLFIPLGFLIIGFYGITAPKEKNYVSLITIIYFVIVFLYAFLITHTENYNQQNTLALLISFLAVNLGVFKWYYSLIYSFLSIILISFGVIYVNDLQMDGNVIVTIFITIGALSSVVLYPINKILERSRNFGNYIDEIFNQVINGIIILDLKNNRIVQCNEKARFIFDEKKLVYNKINPYIKEFFLNEKKVLQKQINGKNYELVLSKAEDLKENVTHILNIYDISAETSYAKELEEKNQKTAELEEYYRSLYEESSEKIVVLDTKLRVIQANKSFCQTLKVQQQDIVEQRLISILNVTQKSEEQLIKLTEEIQEKETLEIDIEAALPSRPKVILETYIKTGNLFNQKVIVASTRDVTQEVENKEKLKTSRENITNLLNNIEYVAYNIEIKEDGSKNVRYVSPKVKEIFGIDVGDFATYFKSGKINKYYHPKDLEKIEALGKRVAEKLEPQSTEYRFFHPKEQDYKWIEVKVFPKVENGRHIANFGIASDISERRAYQEKLKRSEEKYKNLFESSSAGIFYGGEGNIPKANIACAKMMGYGSLEEFLKVPVKEHHVSEAKRAEFLDILQRKGKVENKEWPFVRKDGSILWTITNAKFSGINASGGKTIECTFIDISQQKKANRELKKREEKYRLLFYEARDAIILLKDYKITEGNDWAAELFGSDRVEMEGEYIKHFLANERNGVHIDEVLETIQKDKAHFFEWTIERSSDKKQFEVEITAVVSPLEDDEITQMVIRDVSYWKENEKIISESRQSFKSIADYTPEPILVTAENRIHYANNLALELLQIKEEDIFKHSFFDFFGQQDRKRLNKQQNLVKEGYKEASNYSEYEITQVDKNKKTVAIRMVKTQFLGEEAIYIFMNDLSVVTELEKEQLRAQAAEVTNKKLEKEIKERTKKQNRIRELERYTRSILDSSMDIILATDKQGYITDVNEIGLKKLGFKKEEVMGHGVSKFFDSQESYNNVSDQLNQNGSYIGEFIGLRRDQTRYSGFITISPLKNENGKIIGNVSIVRDISEIKEAQHQLNKEKSKIEALFETASNVYLWTFDKNLKLTSFNENFAKDTYRTNQIKVEVGMSMLDLVNQITPAKQLSKFEKLCKQALKGNHIDFEGCVSSKNNNEKIWLESYLSPIKIKETNHINEVACITHDISEKKANYKQIKDSLNEKEVLLKEVHHRVKNNLQVISSMLNLQSSFVKDENTLEILAESQNRIKTMAFIHENLYQTTNFSSIKFSEYIMNISKNLVHSYQIYDDLVDVNYEMEDIELDLDKAIPCGLIFNELISNVFKHAFDSENEGTLIIGIGEDESEFWLKVEDDGKGIPENLDIENAQSLGFQLVHSLVEQINGTIQLERDQGTKYLIKFEKKK